MSDFATLSFPALDSEPGAESDDARRRGYARGLAEGLRAGEAAAAATAERERVAERQEFAAANERLRMAERALRSAASELERRAAPAVTGAELALLDGAFRLAEAIVGVALKTPEFGAAAALTRVLSAASPAELVRIRLHPDDVRVLESDSGIEAGIGAGVDGGVEFVADPSVARGDALAETALGSIDATIAGALARARMALDATDASEVLGTGVTAQ